MARLRLDRARPSGLLGPKLRDLGRNRDTRLHRIAPESFTGNDGLRPRARDPPFGYTAIGRQTSVQVAGGRSVLIKHITTHHRPQPFNVEVGVLDLERIECPLDQIDPTGQRIVALREFQPPTDARIAIPRQHAQHVAMEVALGARLQAWYRKAEPDHPLTVERPERLPADLGGHHEQPQRQQLDIFESPDFLLQPDRVIEFGVGGQRARLNHRLSWPPARGPPSRRWSLPEAWRPP